MQHLYTKFDPEIKPTWKMESLNRRLEKVMSQEQNLSLIARYVFWRNIKPYNMQSWHIYSTTYFIQIDSHPNYTGGIYTSWHVWRQEWFGKVHFRRIIHGCLWSMETYKWKRRWMCRRQEPSKIPSKFWQTYHWTNLIFDQYLRIFK